MSVRPKCIRVGCVGLVGPQRLADVGPVRARYCSDLCCTIEIRYERLRKQLDRGSKDRQANIKAEMLALSSVYESLDSWAAVVAEHSS